MNCILIFNGLSDAIYMKCDENFSQHIFKLAALQGLISDKDISDNGNNSQLGADIVIQLFSPLITSQRIMMNQFANPYSNIKCYDNLHIVFDEYIGYLFVCIGYDGIYWLKRCLGVFVSIVKHICGPDLSTLKTNEKSKNMISTLMDIWYRSVSTEQAVLVEAVEQLRVTTKTASTCLKTLTESAEKVKSLLSVSQVHVFVMMYHRFVSLYSTRDAAELLFNDILILRMVSEAMKNEDENEARKRRNNNSFCFRDDELVAEFDENEQNFNSHTAANTLPAKAKIDDSTSKDRQDSEIGEFIFILGKQKPHVVHIYHINRDTPVFLIYEVGNDQVNNVLLETLQSLCALQDLHTRGTTDKEAIHCGVESADNSIKKLNEFVKKKASSFAVDKTLSNTFKMANKKWDLVKKQHQDYLKNHNVEWLHKIDSTIQSVLSSLRSIYSNCQMNSSLACSNRKLILPILENMEKSLRRIDIFSECNCSAPSIEMKSALNINKYLEEFPGLVHFIYIDRTTHRFVAPGLHFSSKETARLTRKKIWNMVKFAWSRLHQGRMAVTWKDTIFNYSYFMWFEDVSGTPLKANICLNAAMKTLPSPGSLDGNFHHCLIKKCFPSLPAHRIRCYELFAVHLGLVTSSCVLEQSRRLTATIWEVTGIPTNPLDLL